jgi:hypothetical protein
LLDSHHAGDGEPLGVARHRARHGERRYAGADVRPLVRLNVSVIIEQDGRASRLRRRGGRFAYTELRASALACA